MNSDLHHTDSYCISVIVTWEEAEQIVMEYVKRLPCRLDAYPL